MAEPHRKKALLNLVAFSGGPDSVYLLRGLMGSSAKMIVAHFNHGARGKDSEADQRFVEEICGSMDLTLEVGNDCSFQKRGKSSNIGKGFLPGFEQRAREARVAFFRGLKEKYAVEKVFLAHTADDQVETVLMRILEGAGISGLKGIPRSTADGIERPLLDTWREEVLADLRKHKIPYRIDRSNFDTRFERNWVRHVLIPLLEKRYGKAVKKRIFALGERFRELDSFLEQNARSWLKRKKISDGKRKSKSPVLSQRKDDIRIPRKAYSALPSPVRIRILQILCFERIGTAPSERLLASMDKLIVSGRPSARLNVGRGAALRNRYGESILSSPGKRERTVAGARRPEMPEPVLQMEGPGKYRWNAGGPEDDEVLPHSAPIFLWKEQGKIPLGRMRRLAEGGRWAAFGSETVSFPLSVRPLKAGDRIRPLGMDAEKRVKEILIDRKVPREERWGRPVVCDAEGRILWIPGLLRSAHAPVTPRTRRTIVLRTEIG